MRPIDADAILQALKITKMCTKSEFVLIAIDTFEEIIQKAPTIEMNKEE